jgi:hypothetical protein
MKHLYESTDRTGWVRTHNPFRFFFEDWKVWGPTTAAYNVGRVIWESWIIR